MLNSIDPKSAVPIYLQIIGQIRRQVAAGVLAPGDQLPSVRELAAQLIINPNTAARVYRDLERDGLLETRRGQGTYISPTAAALAESERKSLVSERMAEAVGEARSLGLSDDAILKLFRDALARRQG
jgi:GntR family transcriptional regulator